MQPLFKTTNCLNQTQIDHRAGKVAAQNLLTTNDSISNLRGRLHYYSDIPLIVTYHPAYLLRSLMDKSKAWEDLCFAKATMESLVLPQAHRQ